jgi:acid-sensing ion channel, other
MPWNGTSTKESFALTLKVESNSNISTVEARTGRHLMIHRTDELPSDSSAHFWQNVHATRIEFAPLQTLISEALKRESFWRRKCFLVAEKRLKLFKIYSKQNCEHECEAFFFAKRCGCVPFYLLRKISQLKYPVKAI